MFDEFYELSNTEEEADFMPLFSIDEEEEEPKDGEGMPETLPILALKNTVLFPGIIIPITVGRKKSLQAIQSAYDSNRLVGVVSQRDSKIEDPIADDLYKVGTVARILKLLKLPDGSATAILQGRARFEVLEFTKLDPFLEGKIKILVEIPAKDSLEFEALISSVKDRARHIIELSPNIPSEAVVMLKNINKDPFLLNFISSNLGIKVLAKQKVLEINALSKKAEIILEHMDQELQMLRLKDKIENKVRGDIEKQQRDYFLNQQLKTIQEELGQNPQEHEVAKLLAKSKKKDWPEEAQKVFNREITKLKRMNPQVAEFSVQLNYMELLLDLPWNKTTKDNFNLKKVQQVLDKDHFGLEKVKDRIVEHLAVLKLKGDMKAPIICLVGPPGVGKTSLGKSIANALKRKFIRMSLGGLHDESEIRGHRRTYIGAMPGRILQSLRKVGSANPVFILDEIDKVGKDFRGDPSSALLEVLDPEQNGTFHDNYLEIEYDLSKILFIATANSLSSIQPALLDRMEIIEIGGYSAEEKVEIAKQHLIPKLRTDHGLKAKQISIKSEVLAEIIKRYTRESGVRGLSRQIGGVMRHFAKMVAMEERYSPGLKVEQLRGILGPEKFTADYYQEVQIPGVAVGLAWTRVGGDILFIEASLNKGTGKLTLTGNLGDVMKESATTALSHLKANSESLGIQSEDFAKYDIHIHVPEGAIPKDGPSAGITMLTALASVFNKRPVKSHLAMTGEITLRGKILPVGGIKEKLLAARRAGIKEIILCQENKRHVEEIDQQYMKDLKIHYVSRMHEVLDIAVGF